MCGIVGYTGQKTAIEPLLMGLGRLEYRGYDSSGVATLSTEGLSVARAGGPVQQLRDRVKTSPISTTLANCGIAPTRWATHGPPDEHNAHPHLDASGRIA